MNIDFNNDFLQIALHTLSVVRWQSMALFKCFPVISWWTVTLEYNCALTQHWSRSLFQPYYQGNIYSRRKCSCPGCILHLLLIWSSKKWQLYTSLNRSISSHTRTHGWGTDNSTFSLYSMLQVINVSKRCNKSRSLMCRGINDGK